MIKATKTISNTWETKILKHKVIKSDKCPFFAVSLYKDWVQYTSFHLYNIIIYSLILNELIIQKKKMFKKQTCRIFWCNSKINCCSPPFFIYFTKGHSQDWIRGLTSVMGSCMAYSLTIKRKRKKEWYKQQHHLCRSDGLDYVVKLHWWLCEVLMLQYSHCG